MASVLNSPIYFIALTMFSFWIGTLLRVKTRLTLLHPTVVSIALVIAYLMFTGTPLAAYREGGDVISLFLTPTTAALALTIYDRRHLLVTHALPILLGCFAGALTSIVSVTVLCRLFSLDAAMSASLLPKSVTTPIAVDLSATLGGIPSLTVVIVMFTGMVGAVFAPLFAKIFRVRHPVAMGLAIGVSSHSLGTTKALELGKTEGAMSSLAIGITGMMTVVLSLFL